MSSLATRPATGARCSAQEAAVSVAQVSKSFKLPHQQYHTLKERALHPFRSRSFDELRAVDSVSVDIPPGEFFGIIGRNGSGKSTLLKCIAGIYRVDRGSIKVRGRLSPFIELGVGFNLELTARDNVMINAIMLGLTRRQARERFGAIIDFAELHDFLDLKLKNYSSGMLVRLAFSVAIQVETEILLIDEVLAVGDANFQQKCFDEFERLKRQGKTILFVTHDMSAIERFCDRAMLLERGQVVGFGEPSGIARRYNQLNFGRTVHERADGPMMSEAPARGVQILDGWFENQDGERVVELAFGDPCQMCVEVRFTEDLDDPIFGATLRNDVGATIFAVSSDLGHGPTGHFSPGDEVVYRFAFHNWLVPSRYLLTPSVARHGSGSDVLSLREDLATLIVHSGPWTGGVVHMPHTLQVERR